MEAVRIFDTTVCGLARCIAAGIDLAGEAVRAPKHPRIHVFCATSKIHRDHKLKKGKEDTIRISVDFIKLALQYTSNVEFSPEDAFRTELESLDGITLAAIEAGATATESTGGTQAMGRVGEADTR